MDVCETKRLKLCSVTESDANGNSKPPYTLGYNQSTNLPARVSHECDLYGYYNANGDYSRHEDDPYVGSYYFHFTPKVYVYDNDNSDSYHVRVLPSSNAQDNLLFTKPGVDLTPNPSTMDAWILNYMSLPDGGTISYDYEPDQGTYVNGGVKEVVTGGGLRLKSIWYNDGTSPTSIVKSFNYNESGIVNYMPDYAVFDYSLCGGAQNATINSDLYKNYLYRRSSPYNYFDGPTVVYSKVTVSTTNSGKTDYVFETGNKTNIQNDNISYCTEVPPGSYVSYYVDAPIKSNIVFAPDVNYSPLMGSLICKTDFNNSGNPVHRVLNTYKNIFPNRTGNYNILYGLAIQFLKISINNPSSTMYDRGNYGLVKYKIVTDIQRALSTSIETSFDPKDSTKFTSTTKTYDYSDGQVSSVSQNLSDGSISKTYFKYAHDYFSQLDSYSGGDNDNLDETSTLILWAKNIVNEPFNDKYPKNLLIEKIKTVTRGGAEKVTEGWGFNYSLVAPGRLTNEYKLSLQNPIAYTSAFDSYINNDGGNYTLTFNSNYILDKTYDYYDNKFNLLQYHTNDNLYNVYIWGYNKTLPIAEIKNTTYPQVVTALGGQQQVEALATASSPDMTNIDALRTALPNAQVSTYTYLPLIGLTSVKDPRGIITYYNYDKFGRLINVKDKDAKAIKALEYHYR